MRRIRSILLALALTPPAAHAGATVQLVCDPAHSYPGGGCCAGPNTVVTVDVQLQQDPGGSDHLLRMVEFDFANTHPLLELNFPTTHDYATPDPSDDIRFWRFDSLSGCRTEPTSCGISHYLDFDLDSGPVDRYARVVSAAYFGRGADSTAQLFLEGGATPTSVTVGRFQIRTPSTPGAYTLNLMNAADPDSNRRARVDFGFDPHIIWRAGQAPPNDLKGGIIAFDISAFDACRHVDLFCVFFPSLVSSVPPFTPVSVSSPPINGSLWRSQRNVIRLVFSGNIGADVPQSGEVLIQLALPGYSCGQEPVNFSPDRSAEFVFSIEPPNVLRIEERGAVFRHRTWWVIRNLSGWGSVCPFTAYFPVQVGDSSGDNRVLAADVLLANSRVPCIVGCGDQNRFDIDGDGRVLAADVLQANARVSSLPVMRPCGH